MNHDHGERLWVAEDIHYQGIAAYFKVICRPRASFEESLTMKREMETKSGLADTLIGLAAVAYREGNSARAAQLVAAAEALRADQGIVLEPLARRLYNETLVSAKAALNEESFSLTFKAGQILALDEALQLALAED